ncbi:hypothetical protein H9P43_009334 [Blastocladiella emersonii ATCC 22665]|nr:hypothetical protein H9P43_009334 [Blastocladiella emersonii ATCC 22665]
MSTSPRPTTPNKTAGKPLKSVSGLTLFTLNLAQLDAAAVEVMDLDEGGPVAVLDAEPEEPSAAAAPEEDEEAGSDPEAATTTVTKFSCHVCDRVFADLMQQRDHFRSAWHRTNLQRRMRGEPALTEVQAASSSDAAAAESDGESGGSGSDGGESDPADTDLAPTTLPVTTTTTESPADTARAARSHLARTVVGFRLLSHPETLLTVYRQVLPATLPSHPTPSIFLDALRAVHTEYRAVYLMLGGGSFSGAVFDRDRCVEHTSVHRYTTRRKQGGSQSAQDGKAHAKSAGAQLRRYNEAALARDVWDVLEKWQGFLDNATVVYVVAPGVANRRTLLQHPEGKGIGKNDPRIRSIPFTTRKPNHTEVLRIHKRLTGINAQPYVAPEPRAASPVETPAAVDPAVEAPTTAAPEADAEAESPILKPRRKKRAKTRPRKTGTLPQADGGGSSSGESETDDDDSPSLVEQAQALALDSGPRRLGGGSSSTAPLLPSAVLQGLSSYATTPEMRLMMERERRARAAERRLNVLTGANTPSLAPSPIAKPAAAPAPAAAKAVVVEGPACGECGGAIAKLPVKRGGKTFCGIKCAAAASKRK